MTELPAWVYDIEYADNDGAAASPAAKERIEHLATELGMSVEAFLVAAAKLFLVSLDDAPSPDDSPPPDDAPSQGKERAVSE